MVTSRGICPSLHHPYMNTHWTWTDFDQFRASSPNQMLTNRGLSFPAWQICRRFHARPAQIMLTNRGWLTALAKPALRMTVCQTGRNHVNKVRPLSVSCWCRLRCVNMFLAGLLHKSVACVVSFPFIFVAKERSHNLLTWCCPRLHNIANYSCARSFFFSDGPNSFRFRILGDAIWRFQLLKGCVMHIWINK